MLVCIAMVIALIAANCRADSLASQAYMQAWMLVDGCWFADMKKMVGSNVVNQFQGVI